MIVVAYYTQGTPYKEEAEELEKTLIKFGLRHHIYQIPNKRKWELNCGQKSEVLLEAFTSINDDILYLDADARVVRQVPELNLKEPGICFAKAGNKTIVASGTIFLPHLESTKRLLESWVKEQHTTPMEWDQVVLQRVLPNFSYSKLGNEWVFIDQKYTPLLDTTPIIQHTQASRRLKKHVR